MARVATLRALRMLCLSGLIACCTAGAQSVTSFSPQGEVKAVRQVTARFATPMVAFGDPRGVAPFTIGCAVPGKGRWADPRNWVYDFDADLPAGVHCAFTLDSGVTDLAGKPLAAAPVYALSTGGPAILNSVPDEGDTIDEAQVFILGLDAPASPQSVLRNAWCEAAGINERIGVRIVTGAERRTILDARRAFIDRYLRVLLVDDSGRTRSLDFRLPAHGSDRQRFLTLRDAPDSPLVLLACARTLPAGAQMKLIWGKGIATTGGIVTTSEQPLAFTVRPAFRATFSCPRANKDAQCIPVLPMQLTFSARIRRSDATAIRLLDAAGNAYATKIDGSANTEWVDSLSFGPGYAEMQALRIELPPNLHDDAGRALVNARSFPLRVHTDQSPPIVKFPAKFGILESHAGKSGPLLPVTVRNVESPLAGKQQVVGAASATAPIAGRIARVEAGDEMKIVDWLGRIADNDSLDAEFDNVHERWIIRNTGPAKSLFKPSDAGKPVAVPRPLGRKAFEVVGIPVNAPGFYVVELASPRLGAALFGVARPWYARTSVLVTNLAVHFKLGRESSLVWITRLDTGAPVGNARVRVLDCRGSVYWEGASDASGLARIAQTLPDTPSLADCDASHRRAYFIVARVEGDMAFAFSDWDAGIAPWRYNLPGRSDGGSLVASAVFDRTLVRVGDRVSMKTFVREKTGAGFTFAAAAELGDKLTITHQGTNRKFTVPVTWHAARFGEAQFDVPKDAPLGAYQVSMQDHNARGSHSLGGFRVEQFRVPLMRGRVQAVGGPYINATEVKFDAEIAYLSGGGAGGLPVRLRTQTRERSVTFRDYDDYAFAAGDVREGREDFGTTEDEDEGDDGASPAQAKAVVSDTPLTLDAHGGARATVNALAPSATPRELVAEVEYRDPNGETLTAATRVPLWPSALVLGLKTANTLASDKHVKVDVLALDTAGHPQRGVTVEVGVFKREVFSHRRRLIGGFYAFQHGSQTRRLGALCSGVTDEHGVLSCNADAPAAGDLILRAAAKDASGNVATTRLNVFVAGDGDWWFDASDNDRIDVLPARKQYAPGEVAQLQVRTPFAEAKALVTVEREGILDAFVTDLRRDHPVVDVPIKGSYSPNIYVSVFIVRGRIGGIAPTAMVDLAKPSFKMGIAELRVGFDAHALDVSVTPGASEYRTRASAEVDIVVRRADGGVLPEGTDVAIAAVDEGLLELLPNDSWKLLDAMMTRRGIEVATSTAEMQVIGRRHFGRKAVAAGGGGGKQSARELFDTLLYWKASVALDAAGRAHVVIPLNDSLTSFRIVAIADGGAQWFGTGAASIHTTQPLMLLSGLPPVVREGDRFRAGFTLRNAASAAQHVSVTAAATTQTGKALPALAAQALDLIPGAARDIGWDVDVPVGAGTLQWRVDAGSGSGPAAASDSLAVKVDVVPAVAVRTYQATLSQLSAPLSMQVARPADAIAGRGGIDVTLQAHLADSLPGIDEYLRQYPYTCFEQRISVALGLRDRGRWDAAMRAMPAFIDDDGLVKYFAFIGNGDDVLTSYVLSVSDAAGYAIPAELRSRLESGLIGFVEGRVVRYGALPTADLALRKLAALAALAHAHAKFSPRWLDSIVIEPNLWPTSAVLDWHSILKRVPELPGRDRRLAEAQQILRARLDFQGTTMGFSTEKSDALWWLMVSADSNANRMLLEMADEPEWREDIPRLARGALGRMQRGHWNTTVANAWGVVAMQKFSATFESTAVTGAATAALGPDTFRQPFSGDEANAHFTHRFAWPPTPAPLVLTYQGSGKPWVSVASIAAIPLTSPLSSGYQLMRRVAPVQQKAAGRWSAGDIARVTLDIDAQSDMTWVVISDPIPAGASLLGRGFGTGSTLATTDEKREGYASPAFEERTATAFNAYYRLLPKGRISIDYTLRLNNAGTFALPGTRAEAMYAPEMFGELPLSQWVVVP